MNETSFHVSRITIADAVADLIFVDAAGAVVGVDEARSMPRTAPRAAIPLVGAAGAVGSAVADERLGNAAVFRFAKKAAATPQALQLVVHRIFVKVLETAGNSETAAFVLV